MVIICSSCSTEFEVSDHPQYIRATDDPAATTTLGSVDTDESCPNCGADPYGLSYAEFMYQEGLGATDER